MSMMKGRKTLHHGLVSCDHGLYYVPRFLVGKNGQVNPLAALALNVLGKLTAKGFKQETLPVSFMPGMSCNLCCGYCYQRTSADSPLKKPRFKAIYGYPTPLVNFIVKQAHKLNLNNVTLCLLGGEPLMYTEQLLVFLKALQEAITIKELSIITNGTLLTPDVLEEFKHYSLRHIQFTFDGGEAEHNNTRIYPNGNGSYQQVLEAVQLTLNNSISSLVRINLTSKNVDSVTDLMYQLSKLDNRHLLSVYFEMIRDTEYYKTESASDDFFNKYKELVKLTKQLGFDMGFPAHNGQCPTCADADNPRGVVLTADGVLYSCFDSAGQEGLQVGDCKNGYYLNRKQNWVRCGCSEDQNTRHNFILETFATYLDS